MKRVVPSKKVYSQDTEKYEQRSIAARLEALFLNNIGLVLTRERIVEVATDPKTGREPENWHQRLSELRTDKGYTILANKDWKTLTTGEYVMPNSDRRETAAKELTAKVGDGDHQAALLVWFSIISIPSENVTP